MATPYYNPGMIKLKALSQYGEIQTEPLPEKNLTRVLLTSFNNLDEANNMLIKVQEYFHDAFVVEYEGSKRGRCFDEKVR